MKTKNVPIIGAARPTPWTRRAVWTQQTEWSAVNGRPAPSGNRLVVSVPGREQQEIPPPGSNSGNWAGNVIPVNNVVGSQKFYRLPLS